MPIERQQGMEQQSQVDGPQPSPQEQEQYDLMVANAMEFIYGEKTADTVIKVLSQSPPAEAIANVLTLIGAGMKKSADMAGAQISPEAMVNAATEIIDALLELGQAAGVFNLQSQEEIDQIAKQSLMMAVQQYGEALLSSPEGSQIQAQAQQLVGEEIQKEQQGPAQKPINGLIDQARGV
jgi:hypothetical protein